MVKNFKELRFYPWSGHSAIMGRQKRGWQDVGTVLEYYGRRKRRAIAAYEDYVREGMEKGRRPELVGGGLIRSLGGWSEVLSLRRKGEKTASDERILGSGEFIERLLSGAEEKAKQTLGWRGRVPDLQTLLSKISKKEGVEQQKVRGGDQRRSVVSARKVFCRVAVKRMGYSGASIARYLGGNDFRREPAGRFGGIPGVAQIYLSCFRTYVPFHLAFAVKDIERAISFMEKVLGAKKVDDYSHEHMRTVIMQIGDSLPMISLLWEPPDCGGFVADFLNKHGDGLHHMGLQIEDRDKFAEQMKANGIPVPSWKQEGNPELRPEVLIGTRYFPTVLQMMDRKGNKASTPKQWMAEQKKYMKGYTKEIQGQK